MNIKLTSNDTYSESQLIGLVILRVLIGWHFLYEGISKIINPYWSSAAYLLDSKWILSSLAKAIVSNSTLLNFTDLINMWGLTLVGLSLVLGIFSRSGALIGMGFVLLYYLFAPPFIGLEYGKPGEGSYLIVNKNLIEAFALYILYLFPSSQFVGIDRLVYSSQSKSSGDK